MNRYKLAVSSFFLLTLVAAVGAQSPVVVTNRNNDPVPVKVVNDPAKRAYHIGVDVRFPSTGEPPTVPLGRTFVIEYVSGRYRTFNAFGAAPCTFFEQSFGFTPGPGIPIESYSFMPQLVGTLPGISGDVNALSFNEKVSIYVMGGSPLAASFSLVPSCMAPHVEGRVVFSGYLVKDNN